MEGTAEETEAAPQDESIVDAGQVGGTKEERAESWEKSMNALDQLQHIRKIQLEEKHNELQQKLAELQSLKQKLEEKSRKRKTERLEHFQQILQDLGGSSDAKIPPASLSQEQTTTEKPVLLDSKSWTEQLEQLQHQLEKDTAHTVSQPVPSPPLRQDRPALNKLQELQKLMQKVEEASQLSGQERIAQLKHLQEQLAGDGELQPSQPPSPPSDDHPSPAEGLENRVLEEKSRLQELGNLMKDVEEASKLSGQERSARLEQLQQQLTGSVASSNENLQSPQLSPVSPLSFAGSEIDSNLKDLQSLLQDVAEASKLTGQERRERLQQLKDQLAGDEDLQSP